MRPELVINKAEISTRTSVLWILLLVLGALTYLSAYVFPAAVEIKRNFPSECPQQIYSLLNYECKDFDIKTNPVVALEVNNTQAANQFISLETAPVQSLNNSADSIRIEFEVSAFLVNENREILETFSKSTVKIMHFECDLQTKLCEPQTLAQVLNVKGGHYLFVVKFLNTQDIQDKQIEDMTLAFVTLNPTFTSYLAYFKWILFIASVVGFLVYRNSISHLGEDFNEGERKYVGWLGLALILFNQPFTQIPLLLTNLNYSFIVVIIMAAQTSILTFFWLTLIERLASSSDSISTATGIAIKLFAFLNFVLSAIVYGSLASDQSLHPLLDFQTDASFGVHLCRNYVYIFLATVAIWTLIRLVTILKNFKELSWRDSTVFTFTFCYFICYLFFVGSGTLQATNLKGPRVILLFGVNTLYTLLLQALYAPFELEKSESEKKRKYENKQAEEQYGELDMSESEKGKSPDNIHLRTQDDLSKNPHDLKGYTGDV